MAALELGMRYSSKLATTHLALAAGWSGRTSASRAVIRSHPAVLDSAPVRAAILIAALSCEPDRAIGVPARMC